MAWPTASGCPGPAVVIMVEFTTRRFGSTDWPKRLLAGFKLCGHPGLAQILLPSGKLVVGRGLTVVVVLGSKQSVAVPVNSWISSFRTATSSWNTVIQMLKKPCPAAVRAI